jgi:indoleamine 2,3-dioxygenase
MVVFWNQVRPFSGGSKNAANLPNGLFYEGVLETDEYVHDAPLPIGPQGNVLNGTWRKYAGASAGQSPLIHSLDILLGIHHKDLVDSEKVNPMMEMRNYLSRVHKDFLKNLEKTPSLRELILKHHHLEWSSAFNDILNAFKGFRDAHIQLTSVYIISQALKEKNELKEESVVQETKAAVDLDLKGTGGTSLVKFLKQTRQETLDAMIEH